MSQDKEENKTQTTGPETPNVDSAQSAGSMSPQTTVLNPDSKEIGRVQSGSGYEGLASDQELFVGDFSFLKELTAKSMARSSRKSGLSAALSHPLYIAIGVNVLITLFLVGVFLLRPSRETDARVIMAAPSPSHIVPPAADSSAAASKPAVSQLVSASQSDADKPAEVVEKTVFNLQEQKQLEQGVSLKTADDLFAAKEYLKACYVYQEVASNWTVSGPAGEYIKDYLKLRMAVCLHRAGEMHAHEQYFSRALQSRSAYVRGMACYYLARIHFQNKEYLEARKMAYQSLGLWKAFNEMVSVNLERDLYFLIADSLSREVVGFYNMPHEFPGRGWSENLADVWPTELDASGLEQALSLTAEKVISGAGGPRLTVDTNRPVGNQWSLICLNSPLEETLWKAVTQADLKVTWKADLQTVRSRPVAACLTYVPQQYVMEVLCGSVGLIWQFDGQDASILEPEIYTDFESHRSELIQEAVSMWQRFLLRYRDDSRVANAHYALGRMYTFAGQSASAMGEFKLLQGPFAQHPLAPYAYLEASKIKVEIKDYEGARMDLNEMLLQYPDCPAADEATLYLARATLESGQSEPAQNLFHKAFQMNLSRGGKCEAAMGLGRCAYIRQDWAEAQTWLNRAMELFEDKNDFRFSSACFMLGRIYLAQGQYAEASKSLRVALNGKLSEKEYVQIILELVGVEARQGNYLEAINILGSVPQEHLGQQDLCELLIARAGILREIDATEGAVSLLRRKIEFVADSRLRAWLTLELAKCYLVTGDYTLARRELNDVLPDMQDAYRARQGGLILAQIAEKQKQSQQVETLCITLLNDPQAEEEIRKEAFSILGRIYAGQKRYEKAALAFAGVLPQEGNNP